MAQIGIINEIGDLSLGFDLLNEKDQKKYDALKQQEQDKRKSNVTGTNNKNTR